MFDLFLSRALFGRSCVLLRSEATTLLETPTGGGGADGGKLPCPTPPDSFPLLLCFLFPVSTPHIGGLPHIFPPPFEGGRKPSRWRPRRRVYRESTQRTVEDNSVMSETCPHLLLPSSSSSSQPFFVSLSRISLGPCIKKRRKKTLFSF